MLTTLDIRAELLRRGYTVARLARELGVNRSTGTRALNGDIKNNPQVLARAAEIIGVAPEELAPGRDPDICLEHIETPQGRSTQKGVGDSNACPAPEAHARYPRRTESAKTTAGRAA
ncbi:MAG: helix-turn-helix domain-containing protein [Pseudomonadota bacterium]